MLSLRLPTPFVVAYSGGADSTALLHLCARQYPGQVSAIHIHHGLQVAADDFARHCQRECDRLGVALQVLRVQAGHAQGESPEDAARRARYQALANAVLEKNSALAPVEYAQSAIKLVALAQHADDQVETLLLALSRGAGVAGLAGMPQRFERHGVQFERPLLGLGAQAIRTWLAAEGLHFIDDPTNADQAYTRNKIRHQLLPTLAQVFPQYRETFARTARNMAQAGELLTRLAMEDIASVGNPPRIAALQGLGRAAQANVLRHWLRSGFGVAGSEAQMNELLDQIADCTHRGKHIQLKLATGFVLRQGEWLAYQPPL